MVNYGYEKYGSDFWGKVTRDAASFKGLFYPFQNAIKKHTGLDYKTFRKQAFDLTNSKRLQQKSAEGTLIMLKPVNKKLQSPQPVMLLTIFFHTSWEVIPSFI
jgi:hypothetical protein